jgi:hypothetical protein
MATPLCELLEQNIQAAHPDISNTIFVSTIKKQDA